jgi:2-haloacid dehalogenase
METLRAAGLRVLVVTNGSAPLAHRLLEAAGLDRLAERVVSVDEVRRSKPAPEVYRHAAALMGLAAPEMALVATHPWDIHGARAAGWQGAYVACGVPFPAAVLHPPQVEGETLGEVARRLIALPP